MKHYTETTHIYEPSDALRIKIDSDGYWVIYHEGETLDITDLSWNDPQDAKVLMLIAEVIRLHYKNIIHPTITPTSDEQ